LQIGPFDGTLILFISVFSRIPPELLFDIRIRVIDKDRSLVVIMCGSITKDREGLFKPLVRDGGLIENRGVVIRISYYMQLGRRRASRDNDQGNQKKGT